MKKKLFSILLLLLPLAMSFSVGPDFFEPVLDNIFSHDISQINFTIITFEYHFSFMPAKTFNISRIKKYGIDPQWEDIKEQIKNNAYNNQYPLYKEYIEKVILNADTWGATTTETKYYPSEVDPKGIAEYRICSRQSPPYDNLVIITEGFDADGKFNFNSMIEEMERDWVDRKDDDAEIYEKIWIVPPDGEIPSSRGRLNLFTRLLNLGYDLVLVDLPRHIEFKLEDTAQALAMVMQEVWDESLKTNPIKALGVSMGGLLSVMATNWGARGEYGYSFRTNLVMTSDTPHSGAFMPMSIQNFVYNVKRIRNNQEDWELSVGMTPEDGIYTEGVGHSINATIRNRTKRSVDDSVKEIYDPLNGNCARQLMLYSRLSPQGLENKEFYNYYKELSRKAGEELDIRYVGFISGSWKNKSQGIKPEEKTLCVEGFKRQHISKGLNVDGGFHLDLWSQTETPQVTDRNMFLNYKYKKVITGARTKWFSDTTDYDQFPGNPFSANYNFENAAGGYLELYKQIKEKAEEGFTHSIDIATVANEGRHCFVPVFSAAALDLEKAPLYLKPDSNMEAVESSIGGGLEQFSFLDKIYNHDMQEDNPGSYNSQGKPDNLYHARVRERFQQDWILTELAQASLPKPGITLSASPASGSAPFYSTITVNNTGGAVDACYWDFQDGNGEVSGSQTMTYQFTATGIFDVSVRAENSNGSDKAFIRIIANPVVPIISFTAFPDRVFASLNVAFTPVSTGGPVTDYTWDFGDGGTESYATAVPVSHSFINAGSYTVRLTATGPYGTAEQISFINVDPYIPEIDLYASSTYGDVPYTVTFNMHNSGAPIDTYSWNFDDGQGFITGFEKMTYTFTSPGTYQIQVLATGAGSTDWDVISVYVGPQLPLFDCDFDFGDYGFIFEPDLFRGTSGSTANGSHNAGEGYLTIDMGYGGSRDHSGGWKNEFFVPGEYDVTVQFQYRLTTPGNYESDEYNEVLFAIDDTLYGSDDDKDYLERIYDGGDTGWRFYSKKISLSPGMHTIILGGYNNKSTESAEVGYYSFDDVLITFFAITPPPDFYINAAPFYGSSTLSVDFTTVNTGGEGSFWEWCFDDGSIIKEGSDNAAYSYTGKGIYKVFASTFGFGEFDEDYATVFVDQPVENCLSWWSADREETDLFGNQDCVMNNGTSYRSGRMENSFNFDGMDDYVSVPYNNVYNFDPDGEFSISAWVRPGRLSGYQALVCKDIFAWDWGLWLSGDKFLTGHHNRNLTGSIAVKADEWTHVAVTYNNGTHKLYVNGLEDSLSGYQSKITQSTHDIAFGRRVGRYFEGSLDEIALFDKALSAAGITSLVNAGTDRDKRLATLVYQAEDNTSQGGGSITTRYPDYSGTGYIDFGGKDSYVEWDRIFTSAGTAQLKFRYANGSSVDRTCSLMLNDIPYGTLTFPPTGSWDTWESEDFIVNLQNWQNKIRLTAATVNGGPNLDRMTVDFDSLEQPDSLVSWYPADETTEDYITMQSGFLEGGAGYAGGAIGPAFSFDGIDAFVSLPPNGEYDFTPGDQFSIEVWVKPVARNLYQALVVKNARETDAWDWGLWLDTSNRFMSGVHSNHILTSDTIAETDNWYHVVVTYNNGNWKMYVNTELEAEYTGVYVLESEGRVALGRKGFSNYHSNFFEGLLDEVKIYNQELSGTEIKMNHNQFDPVSQTGDIRMLYCNKETAGTINTLRPWFKVENTGSTPLDLSEVTIRYWYTKDTSYTQQYACDWAQVGASNITGAFTDIPPENGADVYFELGFTTGAGYLNPGQDSGEIQLRIYNSSWSNYSQGNDYSFDPLITGYEENFTVTAYRNGNLIFGIEP